MLSGKDGAAPNAAIGRDSGVGTCNPVGLVLGTTWRA